MAKAETGYENVVDTLDGTILAGNSSGKTVQGRIVVGAGSAEQMERAIHTGDIVIVSIGAKANSPRLRRRQAVLWFAPAWRFPA